MKSRNVICITVALLCAPAYGLAQQSPSPPSVPIYRVTVVGRTIKAINYGHREGPTKIDFRGTVLLPKAKGEAKVESKRGATRIDAKFEHVPPPTRFGRQYLTYVLWAITPQGRAVNLGELVLNHSDDGHLKVTSGLQAFGLLVTAEPYYSVTQPSNVVVMENTLRSDTVGKVEVVDAKPEFLNRGEPYTLNLGVPAVQTSGKKLSMDRYEAVLELYQAQNAVQIARSEGADRYAGDTFAKAEDLLQRAQSYQAQKMDPKQVVTTAREAAQAAQDARTITAKRKQQEESEAIQPKPAETSRGNQQPAGSFGQPAEVRAVTQPAVSGHAAVETGEVPAPPAAPIQVARGNGPTVTSTVPASRPPASFERGPMVAQKLNAILPVQSTPGAWKVNLYDYLFNGETAALTPAGQEKLAAIAGIVKDHPWLKVEVEGYTRGAADQHLLSQRAAVVRDYLETNGVLAQSITARGLTMRPPADDRQVRHVTVILSGKSDSGVSVSELGHTAPGPGGVR